MLNQTHVFFIHAVSVGYTPYHFATPSLFLLFMSIKTFQIKVSTAVNALFPYQISRALHFIVVHSTNILLTYLHVLTPWSRVLLEKLTGSAASQEIPRIFGTRRFNTVFTSARHLSLS